MRKSHFVLLALTAVLTPLSQAQSSTADTFKVNYYSGANSGAPDATVRITNPGTSGGNLCAMVYVFEPDQQLAECCGCSVSPDGLRTLSVNHDLTSNPLTKATLSTGAIKIVASANASTCDPSKLSPTPSVRAWITHLQSTAASSSADALGGAKYAITEEEFSDATLSSSEVSSLESLCGSIQRNGSGAGICTCGTGD